jgi:hypothetical protein
MRDFLELFGVVCALMVVAIFAVLFIVAGVTAADYFVNKSACARYQEISGNQTTMSFGTGCLLRRPDGRWVDAASFFRNQSDVTLRHAE